MRVRLHDKYWNLIFSRVGLEDGQGGHCDKPSVRNKKIIISPTLTERRTFQVLIHEMLHATDWHKGEEWVEEVSSDIADALIRLGYRRVRLMDSESTDSKESFGSEPEYSI